MRYPAIILLAISSLGGQGEATLETRERDLGLRVTHPTVRLGKIPAVTLTSQKPTSQEEAKEIQSLIASLAKLDRLNSPFSPIVGQPQDAQAEARANRESVGRRLVEKGPRALPFLLDALDNRTPTKITIEHPTQWDCGNWWDWGWNPLNPAEKRVLLKRLRKPALAWEAVRIKSAPYIIKVGDVCLVIVGEIVGRPSYQCVHYLMLQQAIIASPTHDAELRADVRSIWRSKDPAKGLFDSLLRDYATEGIFNGISLDGWGDGSELQKAAATRLLYWYPKESASFIGARLRSLDVADAWGVDEKHGIRREVRNGVDTADFIRAVQWSKEAAVQDALRDIAKRTNDPQIIAALRGESR
jgi:hypothetical protein